MKNVNETQTIVTGAIETTDAALAATTEAKAISKAELARTIYSEEEAKGQLVRKDVIARFVAEAGCSKAQAQTYYQTIRKNKGLVHSTPVVSAPAAPAADNTHADA